MKKIMSTEKQHLLMGNLFAEIPNALDKERFETIIDSPHIRIERIISKGQSSPTTGWYDQEENEWVLVLQGSATLKIKGSAPITLHRGDYINLPAHTLHRVEWTDPDTETVWLAVWY